MLLILKVGSQNSLRTLWCKKLFSSIKQFTWRDFFSPKFYQKSQSQLAKNPCSFVTDRNQQPVVRNSQNRKHCKHLFRQTRSSNLRNPGFNQRVGRSHSRLNIRCDDQDAVKIWLYQSVNAVCPSKIISTNLLAISYDCI